MIVLSQSDSQADEKGDFDDKDKKDPSWTQDDQGVKYSIYLDRNGQAYDPWYIIGPIFWNYYITYLSLALHIIFMYMLNYWCRYSKLVMAYSFQVFLLHAYSWALPDRRYADWCKDKRVFFYFLAIVNMTGYVLLIVLGTFLYQEARHGKMDGMAGYFGFAISVYTLVSQTPMIAMLSITMITLTHRFDYQQRPYHPPKKTNYNMPSLNSNSEVKDHPKETLKQAHKI